MKCFCLHGASVSNSLPCCCFYLIYLDMFILFFGAKECVWCLREQPSRSRLFRGLSRASIAMSNACTSLQNTSIEIKIPSKPGTQNDSVGLFEYLATNTYCYTYDPSTRAIMWASGGHAYALAEAVPGRAFHHVVSLHRPQAHP